MIDGDHYTLVKIQSTQNPSTSYLELARGGGGGSRSDDPNFEEMIFFVKPNDHQEAVRLLVQRGLLTTRKC